MSFWSSRTRQPAPPATAANTNPPPAATAISTSTTTAAHPTAASTKRSAQPVTHTTHLASQPPQHSNPPATATAAHVSQYDQQQSDVQYQLEQYDDQRPSDQYDAEVDQYGNEYDDGDGYADEYQQQQQQQQHYYQQQHLHHQSADEYGEQHYDGQYDEYGVGGEDEQWMDEQQQLPHEDEQLMYEGQEVGGEYDEQAGADDAGQSSSPDTAHLTSLHSLASHSHPLHPVEESENEPTSPAMNASALPFDVTLSSTLASIGVDRTRQQRQQPNSPPSAASSLHSPDTPQLMPLSPSSTSRQRYINCVELLSLYCRQSTSSDDTFHAALKLVDGLRYRYTTFAASSAATSISTSAHSSGTDLAAAVLRFMQSSLAPVQLQPLLHHAGRQVVEHLSLALSSVGCVSLASPSSHLSLASSLLQSRIDCLRIALCNRSTSQPLVYVSPHHAADIEQLSFALSLPASSFFVVPTMPHQYSPSAVSSIYTMDVKHLHALLTRHKKERRQSAVLLLTIGSLCSLHSCSSGYQLDDVQQLTDIADEFGLWVHAEGSQLIESGQRQDEYQQQQDGDTGEEGGSAQTAPDNRDWSERYVQFVSGSGGVQTYVPSRVHSVSLHANDYFTLPDTLAFTILTPNAALNVSQASDAVALSRSAVSSNSASVLSLWSQLLAVSSRSFSALLALFPALLTLSQAKLDTAKLALQSFNVPLLLSPADYAVLPAPPYLFFSFSLLPPFNHSYFHLTASQANDLLADNLLRRGDTDAELGAALCSSSLTASSTLFSHTGFLYSSFTPCPAAVDSVERHTAAFHHFLDCVQAELDVVAACGALMPTLHSLMSNESDFELVPPSALSSSTRPGLCAFRFTPAAIPVSFHDELTNSLLVELTAVLPAVFRGGQCEVAGGGGSVSGDSGGSGGSGVIVVEVCESVVERGVQSLVRTVHKLSRRIRLPSHVESELSAELKRSIDATEAKLKAGQAGGGGVIRSIPIVGSFFSFFAGGANKKGHSYNINSSYSANTAQPHTADKATVNSSQAAAQHTTKPASGSGSGASSGKQTPQMKPHSTPATPPIVTVQQQTVTTAGTHSNLVLSAASDEQDGMFSRATSAILSDDSEQQQQQQSAHQASSDERSMSDDQQQQESHQQPAADPLQPVSEQQLFDQLASRDTADLLSYITNGTVLTMFFPSVPNQQHDSASSAIPLYLFYDADSASLCWCEPGARYVAVEQTLPIAAIAELHLGNANSAFPADAEEGRCFSIVSDVIQLHCEEEDSAKRDEIVLALYSLLSDAHSEQNEETEADNNEQQSQQPQQQQSSEDNDSLAARPRHGSKSAPHSIVQQSEQQQSRRASDNKQIVNEEKTADMLQPAARTAAVTSSASQPTAARPTKQPAPIPSATLSNTASAPTSAASMSLSRALELLECGSDFTVFLVDRSNPQLTSRHPVVLWWIPDSAAGKGRLCWSRRSADAPTRLEYHPSRSLLLSSAVELSVGKRTKALCNAGMADVEAGRCVSVMVDRTVLNLAADSEAARDEWLAALHTVMTEESNQLTSTNSQ